MNWGGAFLEKGPFSPPRTPPLIPKDFRLYRIPLHSFPPLLKEREVWKAINEKKKKKKKKKNGGRPFLQNTSGRAPQDQITEKAI